MVRITMAVLTTLEEIHEPAPGRITRHRGQRPNPPRQAAPGCAQARPGEFSHRPELRDDLLGVCGFLHHGGGSIHRAAGADRGDGGFFGLVAQLPGGLAVGPQRPAQVVGFAAETNDVAAYARSKLERKGLDLICANQVGLPGCGFESDDNALLVIDAHGERPLGPAPKNVLAAQLLDLIGQRMRGGRT